MEIYYIITLIIVFLYIIYLIIKKLRNLERERVTEQNYSNTQRTFNNNFVSPNNINDDNSLINEKINKLKTIKFNNYIEENKESCCITIDTKNNFTCSICYDIIDNDEEVYIIPCNHILHKKCIKDIAKINPICPFCRENLFV
jgi:hypothetical protein